MDKHLKISKFKIIIIAVIAVVIILSIIIALSKYQKKSELENKSNELISEALELCNEGIGILPKDDYAVQKFNILVSNLDTETKTLQRIYKTESIINLVTKELSNYQIKVRQQALKLNIEAQNFSSILNDLVEMSNKFTQLKEELK